MIKFLILITTSQSFNPNQIPEPLQPQLQIPPQSNPSPRQKPHLCAAIPSHPQPASIITLNSTSNPIPLNLQSNLSFPNLPFHTLVLPPRTPSKIQSEPPSHQSRTRPNPKTIPFLSFFNHFRLKNSQFNTKILYLISFLLHLTVFFFVFFSICLKFSQIS